jgi:hypothetical protein
MSVNHVSGVGRVVLPATPGRPAETPASPSKSEASSLVQLDETTQQPIPPRFPWLSRLARELEPASKQPSPYGTVPILGEKLDKQA